MAARKKNGLFSDRLKRTWCEINSYEIQRQHTNLDRQTLFPELSTDF